MIIVELCGIPGAGKSTLISTYLKKHPNSGILVREDLYSKNRLLRNLRIRTKLAIGRCFKQREKNPAFRELFESFPDATIHSRVRIKDLYQGIRKRINGDEILILEEGPIQYVSSLAYDRAIVEDERLKKAIRDYYSLFQIAKYHVIYCECSNRCSIERIKMRNKKITAFYDPEMQDMESLLNVKRSNIIKLMDESPWSRDVIDMEKDLEENADAFDAILKRICDQ